MPISRGKALAAYRGLTSVASRFSKGRMGRFGLVRALKRRIELALAEHGVLSIDVYGLTIRAQADGVTFGALKRYSDRRFEAKEIALFVKAIRPGTVVIDVGASIGLYALLGARAAGVGGHVYAFEPASRDASILRLNAEANGLGDRITLVEAAAAESAGQVQLHLSGDYSGFHSLHPDLESHHDWRVETVPSVTIDDVVPAGSEVSVMKIDVEGHELGVLKGASRTLTRCQPKLLVEVSPHLLSLAGISADVLINMLQAFGYKIFVINERDGLSQVTAGSSFNNVCNLYCERSRG